MAPSVICLAKWAEESRRMSRPHSASMAMSSGTLAAACRRLVIRAWRLGPPCKNITPPMFWLRTSRSMRSAWLRSLLEYAATINSWPRRWSGVSELNTLSTQAIFDRGRWAAGRRAVSLTSANDSSRPAASSKAATLSWKGMRISPVGLVG